MKEPKSLLELMAGNVAKVILNCKMILWACWVYWKCFIQCSIIFIFISNRIFPLFIYLYFPCFFRSLLDQLNIVRIISPGNVCLVWGWSSIEPWICVLSPSPVTHNLTRILIPSKHQLVLCLFLYLIKPGENYKNYVVNVYNSMANEREIH